MKIIDPRKISAEDLPLIVFSTHATNSINYVIRWRTNNEWDHGMWMHKLRMFASQGMFFKEVPLSNYMKKNIRLKFWKIKNLTPVQKRLIFQIIDKGLNRPWWQRRYDFLGALGLAIGVRKINNPWTNYCIEVLIKALKKSGVLEKNECSTQLSPAEFNIFIKNNPDRFEYFGHYLWD